MNSLLDLLLQDKESVAYSGNVGLWRQRKITRQQEINRLFESYVEWLDTPGAQFWFKDDKYPTIIKIICGNDYDPPINKKKSFDYRYFFIMSNDLVFFVFWKLTLPAPGPFRFAYETTTRLGLDWQGIQQTPAVFDVSSNSTMTIFKTLLNEKTT